MNSVTPDVVDGLFQGENKLFQHPEQMDMLLGGLRKAGLSE